MSREAMKNYYVQKQNELRAKDAEGSQTPKSTAIPNCPLPRTLSNSCLYPAATYECGPATLRPCSSELVNGALVSYSVNYERLWRKGEEIARSIQPGTPYKSFVKNQFNGSFK